MLLLVDTAYGPMLAPHNDQYVGRSLITLGEYCPGELDTLRRYCGPGDTVFDVGANIGAVAVPLAQHVGLTGKVFAYEPQKTCYLTMCGSAATAGCGWSLFPINAAVGDGMGEVSVPDLLSDGESTINAGGLELGSREGGLSTPMVTVDFCARAGRRTVTLIKIDVEGMEPAVLAGARETIARDHPTIFMEIDRPSHVDALETLFDAGYEIWAHRAPLYRENNRNGAPNPWDRNYHSLDAIAIHPERGLPAPAGPWIAERIERGVRYA